jgi:hypothetical protein
MVGRRCYVIAAGYDSLPCLIRVRWLFDTRVFDPPPVWNAGLSLARFGGARVKILKTTSGRSQAPRALHPLQSEKRMLPRDTDHNIWDKAGRRPRYLKNK